MARPVRHPLTGIWWFRKGVPKHLRELVGKTEEKISLRTRDPAEARVAHARVTAEVEERWRRLAEGAQALSHRQVESIAGAIYREMIETHGDDPDRVPVRVSTLMMDQAFLGTGKARIVPADTDAARAMIERLRTGRNAKRVEGWLSQHGLLLDPDSRAKLGVAVDKAVLQAREHLARMVEGDYRPDPNGNRFPALDVPGSRRKARGRSSPLAVFDAYAAEAALKPRTVKRWRPIFADIAEEVPDIGGMTREWVVQWKDRLVARGLSSRTIRDAYLASLKSVCAWAVMNGRMPANPAADLSIKVRKTPRTREKGFTDDEARRILVASMEAPPSGLSAHYRAARRWVPWLCAFTGARVGEIAQLRREDVQNRAGIYLIHITPEAGTTKTDRARWVPLHPSIIRQGFIRWVRDRPPGPLFLEMQIHRGGTTPPPERVGQHLSMWVRQDVGINDPRIQPNHAWRHRFKTLSRDCDLRGDAADYLQGHTPSTAGESYGDHKAMALLREIEKLPDIDLSSVTKTDSI
ncbi:MAG: DUF6538 domain-containing protein [Pseudomonadota bacterium]